MQEELESAIAAATRAGLGERAQELLAAAKEASRPSTVRSCPEIGEEGGWFQDSYRLHALAR